MAAVTLLLLLCAAASGERSLATFRDVLNASVSDPTYFVLSDFGAWHGLALPPSSTPARTLAVAGPYIHGGQGLVADSMLQLHVSAAGSIIAFDGLDQYMLPGQLVVSGSSSTLNATLTTIGLTNRSSAVEITLTNTASAPLSLSFSVFGALNHVVIASVSVLSPTTVEALLGVDKATSPRILVSFPPNGMFTLSTSGHSYTTSANTTLAAGQTLTTHVVLSYVFDSNEATQEQASIASFFSSPDAAFSANEERWQSYVNAVSSDDSAKTWPAVKAVCTLITNWRSAHDLFKHGGLYPSFIGYQGFWAWDSWKHARALSLFAPEIAISQILAMFDYQSGQPGPGYLGIIPDVIMPGNTNWKNTKPALASWATYGVWKANQTLAKPFLALMLPKLLLYHQWWYQNRDHLGNKVVQFGSTQNCLQCMKWESGMDNAVRFDSTAMLQNNGPDAWSASQFSVDANAFLYLDKLIIAQIADALGNSSLAQSLRKDAADLLPFLRQYFYNNETGFMQDYSLQGHFIDSIGCEAFAALWAGVPTTAQAAAMATVLANTSMFNTYFPMPTLARSHKNFDPAGYWRGPVWIDQFYFAVAGLQRYGYSAQADASITTFFAHGEGLQEGSSLPLRENYNPLTGQGQGTSHFGWSAAHVIMLVKGDLAPFQAMTSLRL